MVRRSALSSRPRLSIVVLPFANLSGDPEQDYFVDRVTESLTTDLSRISASFVIGRPALHEHGKSSRQRAEHFVFFGPKMLTGGRSNVTRQYDGKRRSTRISRPGKVPSGRFMMGSLIRERAPAQGNRHDGFRP